MSQIKPSQLLISLMMTLVLGGCGNENSKAVEFSPESGHPSDWIKTHNKIAVESPEPCKECHGEKYNGGISKVSCTSPTAISGFRCHASNPVDHPTNCVSCHGGMPYGPFGDTAPNRNFAHTKCTVVSDCWTCHLGAGYGTPDHARANASGGVRPATVLMSHNVKAQTITSSFSYDPASGKCFGVSCHGGQPTTPWNQKINLVAGDNTICFLCHELGTAPTTAGGPPSPQYNSFYSGRYNGLVLHREHLNREKYCTNCHNIQMQNDYQMHFSGIAVNNPAATAKDRFVDPGRTIGGLPTSIGSYDKATKTCFNVSCHILAPKTTNWND